VTLATQKPPASARPRIRSALGSGLKSSDLDFQRRTGFSITGYLGIGVAQILAKPSPQLLSNLRLCGGLIVVFAEIVTEIEEFAGTVPVVVNQFPIPLADRARGANAGALRSPVVGEVPNEGPFTPRPIRLSAKESGKAAAVDLLRFPDACQFKDCRKEVYDDQCLIATGPGLGDAGPDTDPIIGTRIPPSWAEPLPLESGWLCVLRLPPRP